MKIALLSDLHFGVRNNSEYFYKKQKQFFDIVFFPYLSDHNIDTVIQFGDFFDCRKNINMQVLHNVKSDILPNFKNLYIILGNHDIFYRHSSKIASPIELLSQYPNFHIVKNFKTIELGGKLFDLVGWINKENKDYIYKCIDDSFSDLACGHFELQGFPMNIRDTRENYDNSALNFLNKYDNVYSGHFHTKSKYKNIQYLGTPYEMSWADFDDQKGFWVLDTKTSETEFIQNPYTIHEKIHYPLKSDLTLNDYSGKIIKLVVDERDQLLDNFIDRLSKVRPEDLSITEVQQFQDLSELKIDEETDQTTLDILIQAINESDLKYKTETIAKVREINQMALNI